MTLDELKTIEEALRLSSRATLIHIKAEELIQREIKLKTMDPRKNDVSGNLIERED